MEGSDAVRRTAVPGTVDLLVRHAYVITMDDEGRLIDDGAIAIVGRRILEVGEDAALARRYVAARTIDARGAPVHPGLIECHLHASFQTFRSVLPDRIPEDEVFDAFERVFYNTVTDEEEYLGVLLASMEMIRNGTTCFMEAGTVLEPSAAAQAAEVVGIRALIGDAFIWDRPTGLAQGNETPDQGPVRVRGAIDRSPRNLEEALQRLGHELRRNADPDALVTGHVAVLGLGTASEELLLEAKRQADAAGVVLNMHHAYSPADTAADRVRYGKDPLIRLAEIGVLDRNVTLGHANHLTDAECEVLIERDASVAWAPAASMMWGHGGSFHGRHAELWRRGANISLGSDSANWSNSFDLFRQANLAMLSAREAHGDRTYLMAEDVLGMATRGGAKAAGLQDRIGSIEAGKRADLVIHTLNRPEMVPVTDMTRNLMYASGSKSVHTVIVDGKVVLEKGSFVALDEERLLAQVDEAGRILLRRMGHKVEPNRVQPRRR
jgi:cytosine/adenosine deaminase-related metal-dependent hydrolase